MASQTWDNDYSTCATDMSTCFYVSRHLTKLASSFVHRPKSTRNLQVNTPKRVSKPTVCVSSLASLAAPCSKGLSSLAGSYNGELSKTS